MQKIKSLYSVDFAETPSLRCNVGDYTTASLKEITKPAVGMRVQHCIHSIRLSIPFFQADYSHTSSVKLCYIPAVLVVMLPVFYACDFA